MVNGTAGNKMRTITCIGCGKTVTRRMRPSQRYCSLDCYRNGPRPQRETGEHRACRQCGAEFYVTRHRVELDQGHYCSRRCWATAAGSGKTEHVCKVCGKSFRWSPSRSLSGHYRITYCSLGCRDADPARRAMLLEMNTRMQRGRVTSAEAAGYALLDVLGMPYRRQEPFGGKFTPDAVIPDARLVVQFDGDYWHDRRGTSGEPRIRRRVELDRSQDRYVRACGWEVARFWATDLRDDPGGCLARLSQLAHRSLGVAPARDPLAPGSGRPGA